ncbi:thioesterase-like superfamily-domain-containing protein [Parachaetomium inaequale]|uniref:Thioesterase-like superfamily-domain-containing protein n=1 Tax=Parachaetomium inaequale TaxID=2588326 RepID=A0AAN6PFY7_9PEZI|nr:thioesterase-like superfamily-domain-containing protein [Parachaetomium inaequale]
MPALLPPARTGVSLAESLAGSACRRAASSSGRMHRRPFSAVTARANFSTTAPDPPETIPLPPPRWTTDLPARIGKCLAFGCNTQQVSQAAAVLRTIATEWKELLAESEGFLTGGRRGLESREIAWGEMDTFAHVNNVNYYRYAETARVNWITNFAVHADPAHRRQWRELMTPVSTGLIMKSLKADFKFPMVYPDKISVHHKLRTQPTRDPAPSSFYLDCVVLSHRHRRVACRLEEDIVVYDYQKGGKTGMPAFMLDMFEETWRLQEEATARARSRIVAMHAAVERLEGETWNRADAVEDMGGSKGGR